MLPLSILMIVFAVLVGYLAFFSSIGAGAALFATGFAILGGVAMLNFWRSQKKTVF